MSIKLNLLSVKDLEDLFPFEKDNREFFETMVPSRGDDYYRYDSFLEIQSRLLDEQQQGISFFFLIIDENNRIIGRMNLIDVNSGVGHIGYRIGQENLNKGIATQALSLLIEEAIRLEVFEIHAKTTHNNLGSQKVLEKNSFILSDDDSEFVHFIWKASQC